MIIPDIIETTPSQITKKQGGKLWIVSIEAGLVSLYKKPEFAFQPITVFIRSAGQIETRVMWMHPTEQYFASEF